jgi:hypothetical protein
MKKALGVKMAGKTIRLCLHDVIKTRCRICSPHLYCNCNKLIKNCPKCKIHIGRCECQKSRSMCSKHGGWALCKCGSSQHHSRCSACGSGKKLCPHKRRMNNCTICSKAAKDSGVENMYLTNTSELCPCGIARKHCRLHGGATPDS